MTEPPDDFDRLLGQHTGGSHDEERRARTLATTTRVLKWSRTVRTFAVIAGVLAVFAAGGLTGWIVKPTNPAVVVVPPPVLPDPVVPVPSETEPLTAERLELNAELADDPTEAARLYREAGDRFLTDRDYENAARCYRRHLAVADADSLKVSASDSWMLHTMKVPVR